MEVGNELKPANEAPADDVVVDAADDDEAGESSDLAIAARPAPRRAPRSPAVAMPAPEFVPDGTNGTDGADGVTTTAAPPTEPNQAPAPRATGQIGINLPKPSGVDLATAVERLRTQVATMSLTLEVSDVRAARAERDAIISQLDDYLLPRLRRRTAPLLAVIGGSTGAGKSTLTNSLVGREVSRSGVLRPTTRSPVLVHHPFDSGAFLSQRILPQLTRVTSEAPEPVQPIDAHAPRITGLRLVPHEGIAPGMAIIDAPDIDSLVETNRDLAVQLLQAADLWIFVTTAARYADAMPWTMLRQAAQRGVAVAVVLDRVPPESLQDLRVHLATRLRDRGLGGAPLFAIAELATVNGFLPEESVAPLKAWLRRVAGDERSRTVIANRTVKGVLGSLPARVEVLADAAEAQAAGWAQLHVDMETGFAAARARLLAGLSDGSLLSGEVLARWQELIADGEFVRRLDGAPQSLAGRVSSAVRGTSDSAPPMDVPITEAVSCAIRAAMRAAGEDVLTRWRRSAHGSALLAVRGHQLAGANVLEAQVDRAVRDWRADVSSKITKAVDDVTPGEHRSGGDPSGAGLDPETAADVLFMLSVQGASDTLDPAASEPPGTLESAAPVAVTVAAARRIVASFIGPERVDAVAADARADLLTRAGLVLEAHRQQFERMLVSGVDAGRGNALRTAAAQVEDAS